jgi:hypothetical protein
MIQTWSVERFRLRAAKKSITCRRNIVQSPRARKHGELGIRTGTDSTRRRLA